MTAFLVLVVATSPVVAQEETGELPMCEPVTLMDLFPELYGLEVLPDDAPAAEGPSETEPPEETPLDAIAPEPEPECRPFVYEFMYPVAGSSVAVSSFGADRSDHQHAGNDIAAAKMTPVVAAADGWVSWISSQCCSMAVRHTDGWSTYYIHLNNDTFGTDDGMGWGIAPGLTVGTRVQQGQTIGWVGDSGNAEDSQPHLHFELRNPENQSVDPAPSLDAATEDLDLDTFDGPFADDDDSPFAEAISTLTSIGLLTACGDDPTSFCPDGPVLGLEAAALIERITDLDVTDIRLARSPEGPWQDRLRATTGFVRTPRRLSSCPVEAFCRMAPITFEDLRELMVALPTFSSGHYDTLLTVDELASSVLGQTDGTMPLEYCSVRLGGYVSNGELAEIVARALGMVGPPPCDQID